MRKIFFVSDAFIDKYNGGAELTTESIIQSSPYEVIKIESARLTEKIVEEHKDDFWIFGNFSSLQDKLKLFFIKNIDYSVIEFDYKYCKYRSDDLHILAEGKCDCSEQFVGKVNSLFLASSKSVWWMSESQKQFYFGKFPFLKESNNIVLNSVFSKETIDFIAAVDTENKNDKWIILNSPSWIKNVQGCVEYAKENNLNYELVWGIEYEELLRKLGESKGLIFLPLGKDTCPRITMEAKLLGNEIVMNSNVQQREEKWFETKESILEHLSSRTNVFWKEIADHVK